MLKDRFIQFIPYSVRKPPESNLREFQEGLSRKLHSQFIPPGTLVFDIGANIGFYAESFLELSARVICVEPQPYCIKQLKQRFGDNPDVKMLELGVAEKRGELVLHIDSKNNTTATFSDRFIQHGPFKNRNWGVKIKVPVTTWMTWIANMGCLDIARSMSRV